MALADRLETNNTIATASTLTGTSGTQTALTIHSTTDQDYFKIILTGTGTASNFVKAAFAHASGDLDMRLYNAAGTQVASASSITNDESISLSGLAAGTYYAQVYGYGGATNTYDLSWNVATAGAVGDRFETNNTIATATTLTGTSSTQAALTIHNSTDTDYFKIVLNSWGTTNNFVKAAFTHASGDLDMRLYNAAGTQVTSASSITNDETISLSGLAAGTYYAQVYGYGGATNAYDLSWNVA